MFKKSFPSLRRPRNTVTPKLPNKSNEEYVIITLKDAKKLVVASDNYHSIIKLHDKYLCVMCNTGMRLDDKCKEDHKHLQSHLKVLEIKPHLEGFCHHLIRQLNKNSYYCTICNVTMYVYSLMAHVETDSHNEEYEKAVARASVYKPM